MMRHLLPIIALIALAAPIEAQAPKREALFYITDAADAVASFEQHAAHVSVIAPQSFRVTAQGRVEGAVPARIMDIARRHNIRVMPLIVNPGWNQELMHTLLTDSAAQARVTSELVRLGKQHGFWGWQFDFEQVHVRDRDAFTRFFRATADALHAAGMALSIAVFPDPDPEAQPNAYHQWLRNNFTGAYDLKALADAGDFISFMTYLQHWHHTPPGPVGGLPYMERVIEHALSLGIPANKLSLGVAFFSMVWQAHWTESGSGHSTARGLSWTAANRLLQEAGATAEWDATQGSSYARWEKNGQLEHLWLEDARAFAARLALQERYGLRGISVWRIGQEDPEVWHLLE